MNFLNFKGSVAYPNSWVKIANFLVILVGCRTVAFQKSDLISVSVTIKLEQNLVNPGIPWEKMFAVILS